jgi:hypothetical protein
MSSPSPLHLPPSGELTKLIDCDPALLDVTLDQLRTLLVVHHTGSALPAAVCWVESSQVCRNSWILSTATSSDCAESF